MSFSWSAPQFTDSDDEEEKRSLTEYDLSCIRADICGCDINDSDLSSSSFLVSPSCRQSLSPSEAQRGSDRETAKSDNFDAHYLKETPDLILQARIDFQHALDRIPAIEKADLLAAQERAPEIVSIETDPLLFLRATNFDAEVR